MLFPGHSLPNASFEAQQKPNTDSRLLVKQLEARVDKLELIVESLWEMLKRETSLQDIDLIEQITEIDLLDGKLDGKKEKTTTIRCPKCERMNSKRHPKCLYCEEVFLIEPFE